MQTLKNEIIKGLQAYMGCDVVPADTVSKKPPYPYLSYKIMGPLENNGGFNLIDRAVPSESPDFAYDIEITREEQAQFSMSVSAYSDDGDEACEAAIKAADWFKFAGYAYLKERNIVVITVSRVGDRTQQLVDDYERCYGFDVRCRAARCITKRIETIESYTFDEGTG